MHWVAAGFSWRVITDTSFRPTLHAITMATIDDVDDDDENVDADDEDDDDDGDTGDDDN